jgi:hypothetical protein
VSTATCGCPITTAGIVCHELTCWMVSQPIPTRAPHRCPVCTGAGTVSRPPWVAGDQAEWASSGTATYPCRACDGKGIVWERSAP